MDGLNRMVQAGKVRYIGISNCFAWQLCRANDLPPGKATHSSSPFRGTTI